VAEQPAGQEQLRRNYDALRLKDPSIGDKFIIKNPADAQAKFSKEMYYWGKDDRTGKKIYVTNTENLKKPLKALEKTGDFQIVDSKWRQEPVAEEIELESEVA